MVTVKDLIERLLEYPTDTPVYWGYDEFPCWEAKKDATKEDFPLQVATRPDKKVYIYFYDQDAINIEQRRRLEEHLKIHRMSLWELLKFWWER